jgi:ribokinase
MRLSGKRPTIHDVADLAGVSIGSVSNVLNEVPSVRASTRQAVMNAVVALGYRPNWIARSLIAQRKRGAAPRIPENAPLLVTVGYLSVDFTAPVKALPRRNDRLTAAGIFKSLGGPAANVAMIAAGLGEPHPVQCELLTTLGVDADSDWALEELALRGIWTTNIQRRPDQRLSRCFILVEANGSRTIINEPVEIFESDLLHYLQAPPPRDGLRCLHLDGYQAADHLGAVRHAKSQGFVTSIHTTGLDSSFATPAGFRTLRECFGLVFLNRDIAHDICAFRGPDSELVQKVRRLVDGSGEGTAPGLVLLTLGDAGAVAFEPGSAPHSAPAPTVEVVDGTGSGDAFTGGFLAAWLNGRPVQEALETAVSVASLSVTAYGAQGRIITAEDLLGFNLKAASPEPVADEGSASR